MRWTRAIARNSAAPLLICVVLAMTAITVGTMKTSTSWGQDVSKRLVPVRQAASAGEPATPGDRVAMRALIIASGPDDFGLPAWRAILDRIGTPYDVVLARNEPVETHQFVRADGVGKYNAILLTNSAVLYQEGTGRYVSALSPAAWDSVWGYERFFDVRQVALNTSPGKSPEDYCLRPGTEGSIGSAPQYANLASAGVDFFDYLNPAVQVPIADSYVYRTRMAPGCNAEPLISVGSDVVGVLSTSSDGRERAGLTFASGADQTPTYLLGYGLFRWATRGVFLGEQRHWLNVDVDDWFNQTLVRRPDGTTGVFRLTGLEAVGIAEQQADLRRRYPLAGDFMLNLAFNGAGIDGRAPAECGPADAADTLTSYSRCLRDHFRWINHTATHPQMNFTPYSENRAEIRDNLTLAGSIDLPVPPTVLKTPEYSGLGVYNPVPDSLGEPTDYGLLGSNKELLKAASDLGVEYVHGNMSFASHRPGCFNCGVYHPLQPDVFLVPDWPTAIGFEASTPDEQVALNSTWPASQAIGAPNPSRDYRKMMDAEAEIALEHLLTGSAYTHTLHQSNLHLYEPGRSLTFDWLTAVVAKYSAYYRVPLKNPDWLTLAEYVRARTSHYGALDAGDDAIWNRRTNAITLTPKADSLMFVTGLETRPAAPADQQGQDEAEMYGSDSVARVGLTGNQSMTLAARPRS